MGKKRKPYAETGQDKRPASGGLFVFLHGVAPQIITTTGEDSEPIGGNGTILDQPDNLGWTRWAITGLGMGKLLQHVVCMLVGALCSGPLHDNVSMSSVGCSVGTAGYYPTVYQYGVSALVFHMRIAYRPTA